MNEGKDEVAGALSAWREGLINLSGTNRLIKFKPSKTGALVIDAPDPERIRAGLVPGQRWEFQGTPAESDDPAAETPAVIAGVTATRSRPAGTLHTRRSDADLGSMLRNLKRRADAEYLDRGLSVLYLAIGMLRWQDVDGAELNSPLLLLPVTLQSDGPSTTPWLTRGEDDELINPALALRLRDLGVELPRLEDVEDLGVPAVLDRVRTEVRGRLHWLVQDDVVLSTFSFHKEAMYKDLVDNEAEIVTHPIVRALATSDPMRQSQEFVFDPIDPSDVDRLAPPEDTPLVLDADSSQRIAIAAAVSGRTFVMDGPPGTGKSQTIANMIGALIHAGKSVLFVSEKIAALDVVRNRLGDAGLGSYLLELHSHKANRKEVAAELARALDFTAVAPPGMDALARGTLVEQRNRLNEYAEAMNETRAPLDLSLHYVLGVLANLSHVPSAPTPATAPADLTQAEYRAVQDTTHRLERAWRPAAQGSTFLWRDVTDETSLEIRLYQADRALEELRGVVDINADLADAFGLRTPSDANRLVALIEHQHHTRPAGVLAHWLTTDDWGAVVSLRDRLSSAVAAVQRARHAVSERTGVAWSALPDPRRLPVTPRPPSVPAPLVFGALDAATAAATSDEFETRANVLTDRLTMLGGLATSLGLPEPISWADADKVLSLTDLAFVPHRPERAWLSPDGLPAAQETARVLRLRIATLAQAETTARAIFTEMALAADVADLQHRFAHVHKGLKKLSGGYRADKKVLAGMLAPGVTVKDGIARLGDAVTWREAHQRFEADAITHSAALGRYWNGRDTDFAALDEALKVADEALSAVAANPLPAGLVDHLTTEPQSAYHALSHEIRAELDAWRGSLAPAPALAGRPELLLEPIEASIRWLRDHVEPLRTCAARTLAVDEATGQAHTAAAAESILSLATAAAEVTTALTSDDATYRAVFEDHYQGAATDVHHLATALEWTEQLRTMADGPLTQGQVKALADSRPTDNLAAAVRKWTEARDRIVAAFAEVRADELAGELDDYRSAPELINELREDSIGQQEWFAYVNARADLAERGLDVALDFCISERVPAHLVPHVIERSLLRAWADHVLTSDRRLRPKLADDRAALVEQYKDLDRRLLVAATSDIVRAANARRPGRSDIGEPAVIRREGAKRTRHIPVRDLIAKTRNTVAAIKPVFMMSPLAVSQYLPPDLKFDVVIFDEASQVTPGDAINCVYRGKALILAGDDKQLPPTSFFERVVDDDDSDTDIADFQSVLELAKGCGAFPNLGLKWHYRSRHEALIAFSNYKFYDGHLVTYPSSQSDGPDVGVEFFPVHGTYRRGGARDNPVEAEKVAERVIHHFDTRPDLSLGVVTFSLAQQTAIVNAVERARQERRDLDGFFDTNDRLNGFFVRSLESVQGDERDVIIFSIGYGPDEAGRITANFGAYNKPKGWRRLNVAITRARQRVEVVSSITAGDIPVSENENVEYLRAYLDYAQRGAVALSVDLGSSGRAPDSPFEESVIAAIRSWGYSVEPQVGAAGFRIDVGVRHPARPGVFALGVECDGYQYHSAPAARDRDRLREQILRGLGWELHRIWGTAWYRHRQQEEARLRSAIETAVNLPADGRVHAPERLDRPEVITAMAAAELPSWTTPYVAARVEPLPVWVDPSDLGSRFNMTAAITQLANVEGPVHIEVVHQRAREAWDIGRVGTKIAENIDAAISLAEVTREGDFIDVPNRLVDRVRTPTAAVSRKVHHVHLSELRLAATLLLRDAGATARADLVTAVARLFGWARVGADISQRVNEAVDHLLAAGHVLEADGHLTLAR